MHLGLPLLCLIFEPFITDPFQCKKLHSRFQLYNAATEAGYLAESHESKSPFFQNRHDWTTFFLVFLFEKSHSKVANLLLPLSALSSISVWHLLLHRRALSQTTERIQRTVKKGRLVKIIYALEGKMLQTRTMHCTQARN